MEMMSVTTGNKVQVIKQWVQHHQNEISKEQYTDCPLSLSYLPNFFFILEI